MIAKKLLLDEMCLFKLNYYIIRLMNTIKPFSSKLVTGGIQVRNTQEFTIHYITCDAIDFIQSIAELNNAI